MDTNDRPSIPPADGTINARRRRRRLDHLLDLRGRLAVLAAEQRAHRLPDAPHTLRQQLAVENALEHDYPEVFARQWPAWVRLDTELDHDARVLSPECSFCQAIAAHTGVNLTPPAAA